MPAEGRVLEVGSSGLNLPLYGSRVRWPICKLWSEVDEIFRRPEQGACTVMSHGMMGGGMMWSMGLIGFLLVVLLVLGIAALAKYLFGDG